MEFFKNESLGLLKNIFSFIGTLNSDACIQTIDGEIFDKLNINPQQLIGQNFAQLSYWKYIDQLRLKEFITSLLDSSSGTSRINLEFSLNTQEKLPVELFLHPFTDEQNNLKRIFFCMLNVAGRQDEADRNILNDVEVSKIYEREEKARSEAKAANRAKDFFVAVVSHDLRSPLNTILGWSKILLTKQVNETILRNALQTIEKSARIQAKLIDDLVDSSRIASGKLQLEFCKVNLFEVLKTVYQSNKPAAAEKSINLEFSVDAENIPIHGDATRLQQIFTNLVSNAVKYTSKDGQIKIAARLSETQAEIIVQDDGQGISAETLPSVFGEPQQNEETQVNRRGLGLGLAIVKMLTEKHSGTIRVNSEGVGRGTTFTVTFPLMDAAEKNFEGEAGVSNENPPLNGVNILVVEDDPDSREVLQLFLEQSGAEVKSAEAAASAIEFLNDENKKLPDVIISDLAMPEEDGFSMLSRIRKLPHEKGGNIPAIALSAFASNRNKKQAYENGFQKYHTKPFEPDGIVQDILGLIRK